jgi:rare lipoprotein A
VRRSHYALLLTLLPACATTVSPAPPPPPGKISAPPGRIEYGDATFYGREENGGPTASGERFDMYAMTAAHRTLRLGTRVRVTNLRNGKQVIVRINDRGPYGHRRHRIIDLSFAAARALDMLKAGVVPVRVEVLSP